MASAMPFMKFFPRDWLSDQKLRLCSLAARGLWFEMLCMMHQNGERPGYLESAPGRAVTPRQLAVSLRLAEVEVIDLLAELQEANVFDRDEAGVIYSRRMVREAAFREVCSEAGKRSAAGARRAGGGRFGSRVSDPHQGIGQGAAKVPTKVSPSHRVKTEEERHKTPPTPPPRGGDEPTPAGVVPVPAQPAPRPASSGLVESLPIPAALDAPVFHAAWGEWLADRRARRKPVTARAAVQQLAALAPLGPVKAAACVRDSIRNGWTGLFPERHTGPPGARGPTLFDRGAVTEARQLAQIREALSECDDGESEAAGQAPPVQLPARGGQGSGASPRTV